MEINGAEGYEEELPEGEDFASEDAEISEETEQEPGNVLDDAALPDNLGAVLGGILSDKEVALELKQTEPGPEQSGEEKEELESGSVEDIFSSDAWGEYLILREAQHMELVSYAESIRNINLCILVGLGVAVGCLLMRQFSYYFK